MVDSDCVYSPPISVRFLVRLEHSEEVLADVVSVLESTDLVVKLYVGYFGRAPEPEGFDFWVGVVESGSPVEAIAEDFAGQPETRSLFSEFQAPESADFTSFVVAVYQNLFGRLPDAAGRAFWTGVLESAWPIGRVILPMIEGAVGDDVTVLERKFDTATEWLELARNEPDFVLTEAAKQASRAALKVVGEHPVDLDGAQVFSEASFNHPALLNVQLTVVGLNRDLDTSSRTAHSVSRSSNTFLLV